jgi:hypothetical protein
MSDRAQTPRSCYDCIHHTPCKWTPMSIAQNRTFPPFISDAHIAPFMKTINEATAQACSEFEQGKES